MTVFGVFAGASAEDELPDLGRVGHTLDQAAMGIRGGVLVLALALTGAAAVAVAVAT